MSLLPSERTIILGAGILKIGDGVTTGVAVLLFGPEVEKNSVVYSLLQSSPNVAVGVGIFFIMSCLIAFLFSYVCFRAYKFFPKFITVFSGSFLILFGAVVINNILVIVQIMST